MHEMEGFGTGWRERTSSHSFTGGRGGEILATLTATARKRNSMTTIRYPGFRSTTTICKYHVIAPYAIISIVTTLARKQMKMSMKMTFLLSRASKTAC